MSDSCRISREALVGRDLAAFELHARACGECAAFGRRFGQRERALAALPRVSAPAELAGRVVAALEAGDREARAIDQLRALGRVAVPEHLDRAVEQIARPTEMLAAPDVLRRLVEEELSDPQKARTRRFVGSLQRVPAPAELDARVAAALEERETDRPQRHPHLWFRSRLLTGAAAAFVVVLGAFVWMRAAEESARPHIQWIEVGSTSELSPLAASFAAGLSGGASELRGKGAQ